MRVVSLRVPDEEQTARYSKLKWALLVCMLVLTAAITGGLASPDATAQGSNIAWDADGNRAPTARNDRFTATEDRRLTIKAPGVLKNDTDEDGDKLSAARLSAPRHGNLSLNSNGSLVYTPDKNYNGPDSFAYKAKDGEASSKATVSIVVAAVNDAPGFTKGKDQGVDEDSGAQSVARWARGVKAGPANESGQRLTFKVTGNTRPSLFARGPAVSPGGTLTYTPARDANGEATIRVRLKDSGGTARGGVDTSPQQGFKITVRPLNDAPVANSDTAEMEENGPPISINLGALVSDVETPDARLVYNVLSGPTAAQGTLTGTGATRTFDSADDYNGTFNILYTVTDRGDPDNCGAPGPRCDAPRTSARKKVAVTVSNVAPTASAQSVDTAEDTSRTITLAASDPGSDLLSFKIISLPGDGKLYDGVDTSATEITSATSAGPFTLSSDKVTYAPDAQFNGSDSFDFKANDGTEDGAAATVSIAVTPVNDLPTDITLDNASVDENQAPGTTVGNLSTTDPDSGDTHSYSLVPGTGDDDNAQFQIIGSTLKTDATFDFETKNSYSIRVQSTDGDGETFTKVFTISVTNVNEAPTDITLSSSSVDENQPSGTDVGTLSTTDPDSGETFTYSFVSGSGDDDNAKFQIAGSTLQTDATFDHETKSSYTVRVRTTDSGNATSEKAFTITVNNANDAPTANDDTGTTDEDTTLNVPAPGVLGNDTDQDVGDTRTVSKLNGSTTLTGASAEGATVTINADGSYTYNPGSVFQHLLTGQQDTDTFTYMAKDSGNLESDAATVTITIDGVTDPPTILSLIHI